MLLQPSSVRLRHVSISPNSFFSSSLPIKPPHFTLIKAPDFHKVSISYTSRWVRGNPDSNKDFRSATNWRSVYSKLWNLQNPQFVESALNELEKGGTKLLQWELSRAAKELRKFNRYSQALQVYEWMSKRGERFRLVSNDAAVQLDLIAKVHGVLSAEDFFFELPGTLKDKRTYGALLNAYVKAGMKNKAESVMETMRRSGGIVVNSLPYNVMMTLYMNFEEYDKVESMVKEMKQKQIALDLYSYNIWLSSQRSVEKMDKIYREMSADRNVYPNWTTYSTMATLYIRMGISEKARECLRQIESSISGQNAIPYTYLVSMYATVGTKDEVYRAWKIYKSKFLHITNRGYQTMISSLIRVGDIDGAERIYYEWELAKSFYDARIANLLMGAYVKEGNFDKAESLFYRITEEGGKPNPSSWETLAEGYIMEKRLTQALSCFKEAFAFQNLKSWKPKPESVLAFFDLCDEEADTASKQALVGLLRQSGFLEIKDYASLIGLSDEDSDISDSEDEGDGNGVFVGQLQGST